jgi:pimeloyl-ACP methyl ester carboxylesterase
MSEFKLFNRGFDRTILLIPGWAADYRIFSSLNLYGNYLMPVEFSPFDFEEGLLEAMGANGINRISVMGWSMGSFLAFDLLSRYKDWIDRVIFISAREAYGADELEDAKAHLKKNKRAFLYKFYNRCFFKAEKQELSYFRKGLMKAYLDQMRLETLLEGLDYLSAGRITPRIPDGIEIKFIHGEEDSIAPITEARILKNNLPGARLIAVPSTGHMPFLKHNFKEIFDD